LSEANLTEADLSSSNLNRVVFRNADLSGAILRFARMVAADVTEANFSGAFVYGCSFWNLIGTPKEQLNVVITPRNEPAITVDNIEVAQFIYMLLKNHKIREVIDTMTSKVVLILGRFTPERKRVLDGIREELRRLNYLPILFDFEKPGSRDLTETVSILAHMARFVIADITDAKSIPQELSAIVPHLPSTPIQPLLLATQTEYGMFEHFRRYPWVMEPVLYEDEEILLKDLADKVIAPAAAKAREQTGR
jgi:Pentapeptide repeats (8 copies)